MKASLIKVTLNKLFFVCRYYSEEYFVRTGKGLRIEFEPEVMLEENLLTIEALTFLTRVGGIIGVGKEFLWLIMFFITYFVTFQSKLLKFNFE